MDNNKFIVYSVEIIPDFVRIGESVRIIVRCLGDLPYEGVSVPVVEISKEGERIPVSVELQLKNETTKIELVGEIIVDERFFNIGNYDIRIRSNKFSPITCLTLVVAQSDFAYKLDLLDRTLKKTTSKRSPRKTRVCEGSTVTCRLSTKLPEIRSELTFKRCS